MAKLIVFTTCILIISNLFAQSPLTLEQKKEDLNFLTQTLFNKHQNPFTWYGKNHFKEEINIVKSKLDFTKDEDLPFVFQEILALCKDLHTSVWIVPKQRIPLKFYKFSDGVYITGASKKYSQLIGHKLLTINGHSVTQIKNKLASSISCDNEIGLLSEIPYALNQYNLLQYYGIVSSDQIEIRTILDNDTTTSLISIVPDSVYNNTIISFNSTTLYSQNQEQYYWHEYLKNDNVLYIKINYVLNKENEPDFITYFNELFNQFANIPIDELVLDLRNNWGGDDPIYRPLLSKFLHFLEKKQLNNHSKFYVIIGRETVSAAQHLINDLEYLTNASFIGEATQQNVHFFSDSRYFTLPNSKIEFRVSTGWLQNYKPFPFETRQIFEPDIIITTSSKDYFENIDPTMSYILELKE